MVPFVVFALGSFCSWFLLCLWPFSRSQFSLCLWPFSRSQFSLCLWPFSRSQFLLMENWQHNMDKLLSYGLDLERAAAWGRNLVYEFCEDYVWNLEYELLLASSREISINQRRRDSFLFRVKFLSLIVASLFKKTTQMVEIILTHTIRVILSSLRLKWLWFKVWLLRYFDEQDRIVGAQSKNVNMKKCISLHNFGWKILRKEMTCKI
jgi:hypothetical protein